MQFNKDIKATLDLEHSKFFIYEEPSLTFPPGHPLTTKFVSNLLEPCTKKKPTSVIKVKVLKTIENIQEKI